MDSRQRVAIALGRGQPDRVPYCEIAVDRALAQRLMGWGEPASQAASLETQPYTVDEWLSLADALRLDNITYILRAPVFAERLPGKDGRLFYGEGQIRSRADLARIQLPDPDDDALYAGARSLLERRGERSAWFVTRLGIFPTILSMGLETFCAALYEDRDLVEEVLDRYTEWTVAVARRVCGLGFDAYVSTDDMAFGTGPFFSPAVFRQLVLPRFRRVAEHIAIPWIVHSDGDVRLFLDDLVELGIAGLHPIEKAAMDIRALKGAYGSRLCLLGNVDLNLLGMATPAEVDAEVRGLIRDLAPGGGYIVTSGNSLAGYLLPDNVRALSAAVQAYGSYPLAA